MTVRERFVTKRANLRLARVRGFAVTTSTHVCEVSGDEMDLLSEALTYHSDGYTVGDITVKVCWDADRLDLGRVGIRPAPERLCTDTAKSSFVLEEAYQRSLENRLYG